MFTGIIEEVGYLESLSISSNGSKITVGCSKILDDVKVGDSIACNGVCLTVTRFDSKSFSADISYETVAKTGLKFLERNSKINLERALKANGRLDGHIVYGHVDKVEAIVDIRKESSGYILKVSLSDDIRRYVVKKGSVSVDGISLTVADISEGYFEVAVIPHTYSITTLSGKYINDKVNIEVDMLARYVESMLAVDYIKDKDSRLENLLKRG